MTEETNGRKDGLEGGKTCIDSMPGRRTHYATARVF